MKCVSLLGIFGGLLSLALLAAGCGESPPSNSDTGGVPTGGVSGAPMGGTNAGGTTPGAGNGSGGSTAGSGNAAGTAPVGGVGGSGTGGSVSGGGSGGVGPAGSGGASSGTAGLAGTGGVGGVGGGTSGAGGVGGAGSGSGGTGGSVACNITVTHTRSTAIPTVEIVTFTTDLQGMTSAHIEFGLPGQAPMTAPVNLSEPSYRTLLLGMKASREYVFRVIATAPSGTCTSAEQTLMTGALASNVPRITRTVMNAAMQDRGFIITSGGVAGGGGGGGIPAIIIDADGDVVWWAPAPASTSRARMSYDGKDMYMMALNVQNSGGEMRKVSMDGMTTMMNIQGLSSAHHDFTVLPDNGIAVIVWRNSCTAIVERSASGTLTDVVASVSSVYQTTADCHTNAINYIPADQTYTLSDRNVNLFVKIRRNGQLVWQFGGQNPRGQTFTGSMSWQVNHGHHLTPDGKFVFFNNGPMQNGMSAALEYTLNETTWTATKSSWEYRASGVNSAVLSDTQRLPNGNVLVTYSTAGQIHEVSPTGTLVQRLQGMSFGYAEFRKSMYGPPLR